MILRNTIVGGSLQGGSCEGALSSEGGNVDSGTSCYFQNPSDRANVTLGLLGLADNGGPTLTHALSSASVAIDLGVGECPAVDQRGVSRPKNITCDSGAYEFEGVPDPSADNASEAKLTSLDGQDMTPPDTAITAAPDAATGSTDATIAFSADPDQADATFECALDGESVEPCDSPVALTGLAVGTHRFDVWATSDVGVTDETPASHEWTVVGAPETTLATDLTTPTESTSARFEVSADQDGSTFVCTLDGEVLDPCHSPVEFSDLGDGDHRFEVRATNGYGLTDETPASAVWTVVVAPETTPESMAIDPNDSSKATFTFTGSDNSSQPSDLKFECALDGGEFVPCGSSHTVDGLAPGGHTFEARAIDKAGNVDPTPLRYEWTVEATP